MTTPRQKVQALDWQTPIVDAKTGIPSPQFMRLWQSLFQNEDGTNAVAGDAGDTAQQALDGLADKADKTTLVNAGNGLTGGGDLSSDRTLNVGAGTAIGVGANDVHLLDTAVTPGTYGDATHVPQLTVDQQGRVTAVTDVAISGGGGGGGSDLIAYAYDNTTASLPSCLVTTGALITSMSVSFTLAATTTVQLQFSMLAKRNSGSVHIMPIVDGSQLTLPDPTAKFYLLPQNEVNTYAANGTLIFPLAAGSHTIDLNYSDAITVDSVVFWQRMMTVRTIA